jgi:hypothetical protein
MTRKQMMVDISKIMRKDIKARKRLMRTESKVERQ